MMVQAGSILKVGIVGTGYAAKKRAEAIKADCRSQLLAVTGNNTRRTAEFAQAFEVNPIDTWSKLVNIAELDLVFVCTINKGCDAIARAAILAGKHVVVEYPLATEAKVAAEIIELAQINQKLLHVEHIEIIGGLHSAVKQHLPEIGKVFYARYATVSSQKSDPNSWKYNRSKFGFPLAAALSRIHRLTDLFGEVKAVSCSNRYWEAGLDYFTACLCNAQLKFNSGIVAEVTYGKGDVFHHSHRTLEIYGEQGAILFAGEQGKLIKNKIETEIKVTPRRGLFAKDTAMVLDYLLEQKPLYIKPQASLYALKVANAAQESNALGQTVFLNSIT